MFKQRLITSLILIPIVLALIFYSDYRIFKSALLILVLFCLHEWCQLVPIYQLFSKLIFTVSLIIGIYLCALYPFPYLALGLMLWILSFFAIIFYPKSQIIWGKPSIVILSALIFLPLFFESLLRVYVINPSLLVYLFCLVWATDIGAYLFGKTFGKNKLIPQVSPGKTWEGTLGGLFLVMLIALSAYYIFIPGSIFLWLISSLTIGLISIIGDLFMSMLKRRRHIKDTGSIFPGHGGILDRLDSLIAAAPLFYMLMMIK